MDSSYPGYCLEGGYPCYQWESRYPGHQLENSWPSNPQEEIVGLYAVPLHPSQWNLIAWWNGCAWEWTQVV